MMYGLAILAGLVVVTVPPIALLADAVWTRARVLCALGFVLVGAAMIACGVLAGA